MLRQLAQIRLWHLHFTWKWQDKTSRVHNGLTRLAVQHAKAAVEQNGKDVYIAGSVGPSPGAIEADSGDTTFGIPNKDAREAHKLVIHTLAEEGVDFLCLETMFSAKEAAIAVDVARETGLPIAVNLTYKWTKERRTGNIVYRTDWGKFPCRST